MRSCPLLALGGRTQGRGATSQKGDRCQTTGPRAHGEARSVVGERRRVWGAAGARAGAAQRRVGAHAGGFACQTTRGWTASPTRERGALVETQPIKQQAAQRRGRQRQAGSGGGRGTVKRGPKPTIGRGCATREGVDTGKAGMQAARGDSAAGIHWCTRPRKAANEQSRGCEARPPKSTTGCGSASTRQAACVNTQGARVLGG